MSQITNTQQTNTQQYHVHVYFTDEREQEALQLYQQIQTHPDILAVGHFHSAPIGPHPVRQFQVLVSSKSLEVFLVWLEQVRNSFDVFIHPDIEDDLLAHTQLARWLGTPHPLKLEIFQPTFRVVKI